MPKLENDFPVGKRHCPPETAVFIHTRGVLRTPRSHSVVAAARRREAGAAAAEASAGLCPRFTGGAQEPLDPLLKCNAKGTSCICSVCLVFLFLFVFVSVFFFFLAFVFLLQLLNLYAWNF